MKKDTTKRIINYNRLANAAITLRDISAAARYLCKLHELEAEDNVEIGSYRMRNI